MAIVVDIMIYRCILCFCLIAFMGCQQNSNAISKSRIMMLFTEVKALYLAGNVQEMMTHYSDDIVVIANIKQTNEKTNAVIEFSFKYSKERYQALVESIVNKATDHTYDIDNLEINIADDARTSSASFNAIETISKEGKEIISKSFVELSFSLSATGKLLISSMVVTQL